MKLDGENIKKLALLSRLSLTDEQVEQYSNQLSSILDYAEQLNDLDLDGFTQDHFGLKIGMDALRDDVVLYFSDEMRADLLSCAPDRDGDFIKTPQAL